MQGQCDVVRLHVPDLRGRGMVLPQACRVLAKRMDLVGLTRLQAAQHNGFLHGTFFTVQTIGIIEAVDVMRDARAAHQDRGR